MKEPKLKEYLKNKESELKEEIIRKMSNNLDANIELRLLGLVQNIINICESRNRY